MQGPESWRTQQANTWQRLGWTSACAVCRAGSEPRQRKEKGSRSSEQRCQERIGGPRRNK
ncbi:hypothetical protein E2562_019097 [Oryza meyeriana var. granulata]|uniref:Uncharacterized protein n=1 Tax=Oryza meyeriana var. granulata TaxID=110450 RepID=A0A6G1CRJ7_9ORYZ|nr:hypothetical protein E2562_019097 [Oryza meyeriana var. granulata]